MINVGEQWKEEMERAERNRRRRAVWIAMEDGPTEKRLVEIASEHIRWAKQLFEYRDHEFVAGKSHSDLTVETIKAHIYRLAAEREKLIAPFLDEE